MYVIMALYFDSLGFYKHDWQSENKCIPGAKNTHTQTSNKEGFSIYSKIFILKTIETLRYILNKNSILKIYLISLSYQANFMNSSYLTKRKNW